MRKQLVGGLCSAVSQVCGTLGAVTSCATASTAPRCPHPQGSPHPAPRPARLRVRDLRTGVRALSKACVVCMCSGSMRPSPLLSRMLPTTKVAVCPGRSSEHTLAMIRVYLARKASYEGIIERSAAPPPYCSRSKYGGHESTMSTGV